jgi:hypothetical protein
MRRTAILHSLISLFHVPLPSFCHETISQRNLDHQRPSGRGWGFGWFGAYVVSDPAAVGFDVGCGLSLFGC